MPFKTWDTKTDWDNAYNMRAENSRPQGRSWIRLGYTRATMYPICENRASKIHELFGSLWTLNTKILIVGSGFGWTAEILELNYGYTNVLGIDTSNYIQNNQDSSDETEIDEAIQAVGLDPTIGEGAIKKAILFSPGNRRRHSRKIEDEGLQNNGSRNRVRSILNGIEVGISESVIESLTDSEVIDLHSRINATDSNIQIIHLVVPLGSNQDSGYNWKTLADWKALIPTATWVSLVTWEVL